MYISKFSEIKYKSIFQNKTHIELLNASSFKFNYFNKEKIYKHIKIDWTSNKSSKINNIYELVSYFIIVVVTRSNIMCNIMSVDGKVLVHLTSGKVGLKGPNKSKKFSMVTLLKKIMYNYDFLRNKPVIVKLKGLKYNNKLILKKFSEKFLLKAVIYENTIPHNGCRPKKIKRR